MARRPQQETPPQRRNWTCPVGAEARVVGHAAFARAGFADETLVLHWPDIAGEDIARLARPLRLAEGANGGVLTLCTEPAAAVFLQHESRSLRARINAYFGREAIVKLRFVESEKQTGAEHVEKAAVKQAEVPAVDPARDFEGPENLKRALLELAGRRQGTVRDDRD